MEKNNKVYNNFSDRFGNVYSFNNYMDFAKFWFSLKRKTAIDFFGENFKKLQYAATNSKEAKTKI